MRPKAFISFVGFVLLLAATWCPLLRPFGLMNWDLYDLNKPYGMVVLLISVVGIAGIVLKQYQVARIAAWLSLALVVLVYIAAIMKVNTTFSFIPFKGLAGSLAKLIKFKWGWYLLFLGPVLSVFTTPKPVADRVVI
ncbi:hypothetical protein MUGA111182_15700 [Mucilaginibacter galii]|uniref:hypothetical protein n=1 Tax=Mucilaginibacter galii TaxID=2005073 RepID=UPI0016696072|nr:hypothetical protein [Mucilaginibacter galii]